MKILITGSTGLVGRSLVIELIKLGYQILEITIEPELSGLYFGSKTEKYIVNDDQQKLKEAIKKFEPKAVIHLASLLTAIDEYPIQQKLLESNIIFFCRILDAVKDLNIELFINTGSFSEFKIQGGNYNPAYFYSATKTASRYFLDYYSESYDFKQTSIVPYTIYGGIDRQKKVIDLLYDSIYNQEQIDLSPGEQILDFIHVSDVVNFYITILRNIEQLPKKSNFNLGTGKGHTLRELAGILENLIGEKSKINWGGKPYRINDVMYAVADITLQKKMFGWDALIDINKGLKMYIENKKEK